MTCPAKPRRWGIFGQSHDWKRITNPLAVERGGLSTAHDIKVGARCTACKTIELRPLPPPFSVTHTTMKFRWVTADYALEVPPDEAWKLVQEAANDD